MKRFLACTLVLVLAAGAATLAPAERSGTRPAAARSPRVPASAGLAAGPRATTNHTGPIAALVVQPSAHDVFGPLASVSVPAQGGPPPGPRESERRARPTKAVSQRDPVARLTAAPDAMPAPSQSFPGLQNSLNSPPTIPPDVEGDVGPSHYVELVNNAIGVWSKTGTLAPGFPKSDATLWAGFSDAVCASASRADPIVLYDQLADRWLLSEIAYGGAGYRICVAVSTSGDPGGSYNRYAYAFSQLPDYPKLGVWPDGYYLSVNLAGFSAAVAAFDRTAMIAGANAPMLYVNPGDPNLYGMLPADLDGVLTPAPGSPALFAQYNADEFVTGLDALSIWRFQATWGMTPAGTFSHSADVATAPFDPVVCNTTFACIPQKDTAQRLDEISDLLMYRLVYRRFADHDALVVNHTVDADGAGRAGVRWYEVRDPLGSPAMHQQATHAPSANGESRWVGSIAIDASGDIALGFNASGPSTYPSIRYAGRLAADPLGQLAQGEGTLLPGTGSQAPSPPGQFAGAENRWGDYSTLSVDPSDGCTFWYAGEHHPTTNELDWRTWISAFKFPQCGAPTAVAVAGFRTAWTRQGVAISWRTGAETSLAGFHLWRTGRSGVAKRITPRLIRARHAGSAAGARYRFVDRSARRGSFAAYRLQVVGLDGTRRWYGVGSAPSRPR